MNSIDYFHDVLKTVGAPKATDSYRLFMVPGMGHCRDGEGTDQFDTLAALEQWREKGNAPELIVGSRVRDGKVDRTRPLCPYPEVASYKGVGNTNVAANFSCRVP
jgi:tannase/feruloyl esterase